MHTNRDEPSASSETRHTRPRKLLKSALVSRTDSITAQLFRSVLVGGLATAVDMSGLYAGVELVHMQYLAAAAAGYALGILVNYVLSVQWIFASRAVENRPAEFTLFATIGIAGLGWTELIIWSGVEMMGLRYMPAKILSVIIVFIWNFGMRRAILFRRRNLRA